MKSLILSFISVAIFILPVFSQNQISETEARQVTQNFYFERINQIEEIARDDIYIQDVLLIEKNDQQLFYAVNLESGFVLVSAHKNVYPVLGYAFKGIFLEPDKQENVAAWLGQYERQISHAIETDAPALPETQLAWEKYLDNDFSTRSIDNIRTIEPMLISTWDQGTYYNGQCPADPSGVNGHCVTGCVATALGQLVYYFRFPQTGTGSYSYEHPDYGTISANFAEAEYDYNQMMNALNAPNPEVAELIFHLGVACDMVYGPQSSGMYNHKAAYALRTFFKYSPETAYVYRDSTTMDWDSLMVAHLDQKIPMYYAGWSVPNLYGHAFIVDGYQEDHFYHFNWGWGGSYDGYFYTEQLTPGGNNFNLAQELIINAFPDTLNYTYPDFCEGSREFTFKGGTITDGSYPVYNYQNNADCQWLIDPQNEMDSVTSINLSFQRFDLENEMDFVNVNDGETINAPLLGSFTGNEIPLQLTSSGNKMLLTFTSDDQNSAPGFFATFKSNQPTWCSGTTVMFEQEAEFSDGSQSFFYNNSSTCMWQIMPMNASSVTLYFNSFDTEAGHDHVKIYDTETMELLADYSGYYPPDALPPPVTSPSGKIFFLFHTDAGGRAQGWEAGYYANFVNISEQTTQKTFTVFPNPAKDIIYISGTNASSPIVKAELINAYGKSISTIIPDANHGNTIHFVVTDISAGIYILEIHTETTIETSKVLIR
jgi:hypothetical protein